MYKIVFVVCVFAFALQGAFSSPVGENEPALQGEKLPNSEIQKNTVVPENDGDTTTSTITTPSSISTTTPKNGASSSEICILLVQVSSLALIAKQMLL